MRIRSGLVLLCLCVGLIPVVFPYPVYAQQDSVVLRNGVARLDPDVAGRIARYRARPDAAPVQALVRLAGVPDAEQREALSRAGISLMDYLGQGVFLSLIRAAGTTVPVPAVLGLTEMEPRWKIAPELLSVSSGRMEVAISWMDDITRDALEAHIASSGARILDRGMWSLGAAVVSVPAAQLRQLADWYGIRHIDPAARDTSLNAESAHAGRLNAATDPVIYGGRGLSGQGVTVGVGDNFSGLAHVDLSDRIINFHPWPYHNHGVHINGIVGGAGIMDLKGRGAAPAVRLLDHVYALVWQQAAAMKQAYGMTLTNNSYAAMVGNCGYAGRYDIYSERLDRLSLGEPDVLHVFAAGNDGNNTCGLYPQGFGTVVGAYQAAKNVLVVASHTKRYEVVPGSGRGPVRDGRLKPEISAVGAEVYSTTRDDGYLVSGGTSMACPGVSGALALLTQRYRQLHGGTDPRADVLRALILNGATDAGNPGPDFSFGFGTLNLGRSLDMLEESRYRTGSVAHGDRQVIRITVPPNTAQLKIMLNWHDVPGNPSASRALVNDLDLEVTGPDGSVVQPLVLNPDPAHVRDDARPGVDRLNNTEQVVITLAAAGTYELAVSGYEVPMGPQDFVVSWDLINTGVEITFPAAGASWAAADSMRIYWEGSPAGNTQKLEFSADDGASWTTIADQIPADRRTYAWMTPDISSAQCRIRLSRNNSAHRSLSAPFTINRAPDLRLQTTQCPGYMAIEWSAVAGVTAYEVLRKLGTDLAVVDTVTDTRYTFSGLPAEQMCYAAVRPLFGAVRGWRSKGIRRLPKDGDCMGGISDHDLMAERVVGPGSGRMHTATELSAAEFPVLQVRNLDDVPVSHFRVDWQWNGGVWESQDMQLLLPANGTMPVQLGGHDLSAPGSYELVAVVHNLSGADPVPGNDTIRKVIRQLRNDPVDVSTGFTQTFEAEGQDPVLADTVGVTSDGRWDFRATSDTARLRFFVSPEIGIYGERSVSLDAPTQVSDNQNYLDGTFNLVAYDTLTDEVRLDFSYKWHGLPKFPTGNQVWVRGNDRQSWSSFFFYDTLAEPGTVTGSGSLSLTDALCAQQQNFSSSFQLRFGQRDTGVIAAGDYGNGVTLDDVHLYTVRNDMQLVRISVPETDVACNRGMQLLSVVVRNGSNEPQFNVRLFYRLDSGTVYTGVLQSLPPKDTVSFTFPEPMDLSRLGTHRLDVWLDAAGDTYRANDSILGRKLRTLPSVSDFPYLERFEAHDGYWYAEGKNSSWEYGTPASPGIRRAAGGSGAWKTGLEGSYRNSEHSFLYSPCFNLSSLKDPVLSFSMALDIEHCDDEPCDAAWMEYSVADGPWEKLGRTGQGTNWYNTEDDVWSMPDFMRWHVASIPLLPKDNLRLRFVLKTDSGLALEGLAVDDVHIFDRVYPVYTGGDVDVTASLMPAAETDFAADGKLLARINPGNSRADETKVSLYSHSRLSDSLASQYFFPVSFSIRGADASGDSMQVQLFITEQDMVRLLTDSSCLTCSLPEDAYSMGVTSYADENRSRENGTLADNVEGVYHYRPAREIDWVPYDNGYYAHLRLSRFSELWFNDGGALGRFPLTVPSVLLWADKRNATTAELRWVSRVDTAVSAYVLERSYDGMQFDTLTTVPARRITDAAYTYTDEPSVAEGASVFYRVRYFTDRQKPYYTRTEKIDWTKADRLIRVYPNPARNGQVAVAWSSMPGGSMVLSVTDILGREVFRQLFPASGWNNVSRIQVSGMGPGIYLVRAVIGSGVFEEKLVVQ